MIGIIKNYLEKRTIHKYIDLATDFGDALAVSRSIQTSKDTVLAKLGAQNV